MPPAGTPPPEPSSEPPLAPVAGDERVDLWDVLRGIAILGILPANMPWHSSPDMLAGNPFVLNEGGAAIDRLARQLVYFFVDTKFITLFSLLFGAGLALVARRAAAAGRAPRRWLFRRLSVLLVIGLAHWVLIWFGDIVASYALVGFVALWFIGRAPRLQLRWAAALFLIGAATWAGFGLMDPADMVERIEGPDGAKLSAEESLAHENERVRDIFSSGDTGRMIAERASMVGPGLVQMAIGLAPRTLSLFLAGMALVSSGILLRPRAHRRFFVRLAIAGAAVGLPLQGFALLALDHPDDAPWRAAGVGALAVGGAAMSLLYLGLVALWCETSRGIALRARLAAVGRMAFTNYLTQSVICAAIFNYAGLYGRVGTAAALGIAVPILLLQLWWSPLWLARFRSGPVEWAWRSVAYGRRQPWRRIAGAGNASLAP